jgi:hypothetical protein
LGIGEVKLSRPFEAEPTTAAKLARVLFGLGRIPAQPLFPLPSNQWSLNKVRSELDATGLASCMQAPNADSAEELNAPYPISLFEPESPHALVSAYTASAWWLLYFLAVRMTQRMKKRPPSERTLVTITVIGLLSITFGLFLLITLLNTPGWIWNFWILWKDFLPAFLWFWNGCMIIQTVSRAYRMTMFGIEPK